MFGNYINYIKRIFFFYYFNNNSIGSSVDGCSLLSCFSSLVKITNLFIVLIVITRLIVIIIIFFFFIKRKKVKLIFSHFSLKDY